MSTLIACELVKRATSRDGPVGLKMQHHPTSDHDRFRHQSGFLSFNKPSFLSRSTHNARLSQPRIVQLVGGDQELAVLAISVRLFIGYVNNCPNTLGLAEDEIHLFKGSIGRFRIKEIDCWENHSSVNDSKDDICLIAD